jgi:predicted DNA-binding protein (MmcQ/YjbR family)
MSQDATHERLLAIVKSLPETEEAWPWGSIHCKVAGKIFVGWSRGSDGVWTLGVRATLADQAKLVASDPRVSVAKYVGKYGGIDIRLAPKPDWKEMSRFIVESYRLIAPKRLVAKLAAADSAAPRRRNATATAAKTPQRAARAKSKKPAKR